MDFAINRIQHIGIPVTDINLSEQFYNKLGFLNVMSKVFAFKDSRGIVAMMQRGTMIIELYQLPESEYEGIATRQDGHVDHFAFDVNDIDEAFTALSVAGFNIIEPEPVYLPFWKNGCRYFNIMGPNGERLEFNQLL